MNQPITLPGFEGQKIEVQPFGLFSGTQLLINGKPAPKGFKRGEMLLTRDDGRTVIAQWKSQFVDVPKLLVDGQIIQIVEPLAWYQWLLCGLPVLLMLIGGALGALIGFLGFSINAKIIRSDLRTSLKYALPIAVSFACMVIFYTVAGLFMLAINGA